MFTSYYIITRTFSFPGTIPAKRRAWNLHPGRSCPRAPTRARAYIAAWMSSNFATATYVESINEITVACDGNRLILNDQGLRNQFPGSGSYPVGAPAGPEHPSPAEPQFPGGRDGRPVGHDIIAKIICKQSVCYIMDGHPREPHGEPAITLRHLRFKLTDYEGNVVNLCGASISFCIYLDG